MNKTARQTLMNECGLTRELIQQEMREIIREEVQKFINDTDFIHKLAKIIMDGKHNLRYQITCRFTDYIAAKMIKEFTEWRKQNDLSEM